MALSYTIDVNVGSTNVNEDHLDYIASDAVTTAEDYILSGSKGTVSLVSHVRGTENIANWKACTDVEFVLMCAPASYPELSGTQKKVVKSQKMTTRDSGGAGGSCTLDDAASVLVGGNNLYVGLVGYDSTGNVVRTTNMQYACKVEQGSLVSELTDGETVDSTALSILQDSINEKLSKTGYAESAVGKIPVVDSAGNLNVRSVHLLIDPETDGGSLVLRGAVGQIVASITMQELQEAIGGGGASPEAIKSTYWSGYKYPDGTARVEYDFTVSNLSLHTDNGVGVTNKLFTSSSRKFPAVFIKKPEIRATYIPDATRVHIGAYATYQKGDSDTATDGTYQNPPDIYIVCNNNTSTTLKGTLRLIAEGRWK